MFPFFSMICSSQLKKINNQDYFKILEALNIKEDLVINSNAKIAIRKRTHRVTKQKKKKKTLRQKESSTKKPANYLHRNLQTPEVVSNLKGRHNSARGEGLGVFRRMRKKLLEPIYTKGPAAYGSVKNQQKSTNLKPSKVKLFLEGQNSHTNNKKYRKRFPTLKVIA